MHLPICLFLGSNPDISSRCYYAADFRGRRNKHVTKATRSL